MLEWSVAACVLLAVILYALTGGADFGGGLWDLLASGPRAERQRIAIAEAIGPIWEADHVWLILVVVLLFTAFPSGFSAMMTALSIPITAMLLGIVLRGSALIFRKYDSRQEAVQRRWSAVFGAASCFTPLSQGVIIGALATGQIRVVNDHVVTGFFAGWLTPFALLCGGFALTLFAFLAATYLTVETEHQRDVQEDFRRKALWSNAILVPIAAVVFLASRTGAPEMFHSLTRWWALPLVGATILFAIGATVALRRRRFGVARIAAIGQVSLILVGWGLAQYPDLITPDVTVASARAPEVTLRLLLLALGVGAVILLPSLLFLFRTFKSTSKS